MFFWYPDLSADIGDPRVYAVRRCMDLYYAVHDHTDGRPDFKQLNQDTPSASMIELFADCGYVLRLELRLRGESVETGFTLMEMGKGSKTGIIRAYRRYQGPWLIFHINLEHAAREMSRLVMSAGMEKPSVRYEMTERAANVVFGKCCEMMLFGFMKR
jgi:hypothetical protein